ncbi:hypothetical protein TOPH_05322, partial [Tolypocladium ophioglossoides CBS 100239]
AEILGKNSFGPKYAVIPASVAERVHPDAYCTVILDGKSILMRLLARPLSPMNYTSKMTGAMETTSTFWHLKDLPHYQTTKPYVVNLPLSLIPTGKRTNQDCFAYSGIKVRDLRSEEDTFTLDRNGFEVSTSIPMSLEYEEFRDPSKVRDVYSENVKAALLEMTGAESAHVLHQMQIRRRHPSFPEKSRGSKEAETDQPVQGVHCDYTPRQAYESVRTAFGDEKANEIWNERRVQIIQVWRPLRGPVVDWPLAVCDSNSINKESDLVATDNVWSYAVFETYNVLHNPKHAWYYISKQTSEDVLLFKGFDNAKGVSTFCAHAAFHLKEVKDVSEMRESVECAILLMYPKLMD